MRCIEEELTTVNSTVLNRIARRYWKCNHCPANRRENANRKAQDDRAKNHRRGWPRAYRAVSGKLVYATPRGIAR